MNQSPILDRRDIINVLTGPNFGSYLFTFINFSISEFENKNIGMEKFFKLLGMEKIYLDCQNKMETGIKVTFENLTTQ